MKYKVNDLLIMITQFDQEQKETWGIILDIYPYQDETRYKIQWQNENIAVYTEEEVSAWYIEHVPSHIQ